jgi:hypothetical protein
METIEEIKQNIRDYCKNHGMKYDVSIDLLMTQIDKIELKARQEQRNEDYEIFVKNR